MNITEGTEFCFYHNADFSGEVIITDKKTKRVFVELPFADLRILVTAWARHTRAAVIKNATDQTVHVNFARLEQDFPS